jgi:hypothetical protein
LTRKQIKFARKQFREAEHNETQGFVSQVHLSLKKGYVSVEEPARQLSHDKVRSFSTTFLLSTKAIFPTKREDQSPHKLATAHHNLGS